MPDGDRIAIVGSREYPRLDLIDKLVYWLPPDTTVVSGGARGVDQRAAQVANAHGLATDVFLAEWDKLGKRAGILRNQKMIDSVTHVAAFYDGKSRGTAHAVNYAMRHKREVRVYGPEGQTIDPRHVKNQGGLTTSLTINEDTAYEPDQVFNSPGLRRKRPSPNSRRNAARNRK